MLLLGRWVGRTLRLSVGALLVAAAAIVGPLIGDVFTAAGETDVMHLLRRMKAEAALMIALCDIGGVWPVMRVTAALTDLAVEHQ